MTSRRPPARGRLDAALAVDPSGAQFDAEPEVRAPKIVQIAADEYRRFALTDAGEVWTLAPLGWEQVPPLPTPAAPT